RDLVLETAIEAAAGRVPVLVGISEQTTVRVLAEADRLLAIGGDAAVVTTPFYALSDAAEVERHLRTGADHIDGPLFAYDVPVRTQMKMPFDGLVRRGQGGVLRGALFGGAAGIVPGLGNVDPAGYVRIFDAARAEEWAAVVAEQDRLARLFEITGAATPGRVSAGAAGLGGFKTALRLM